MAYARHRETLDAALADGAINEALDGIGERLSACDYIFLCTPVSFNEEYLTAIRPYLRKDAILTDVGSVKTNIHEAVERLGMETNFIGGHPMAGSEKSGYQYSTDHLVENAYYVITPTKASPARKVDELREIALSLSALPLILDYHQHDYIVAGISHLPHLIASSLVNLVRDKDTPEQTMRLVAAGGFKDITRIASSSPVMWQEIRLTNRENIASILGDYIDLLRQVKTDVETSDGAAICDLVRRLQGIPGIPFPAVHPVPSKKNMRSIVTLWTKPVRLPPSPRSLPLIRSVLRTSASSTTGNLRKVY